MTFLYLYLIVGAVVALFAAFTIFMPEFAEAVLDILRGVLCAVVLALALAFVIVLWPLVLLGLCRKSNG
jgi:hypothetical protein